MDITLFDVFIMVELVILISSGIVLFYNAKKNDGKVTADEVLEILNKLRSSSTDIIYNIISAKLMSETEQKKFISSKLLEMINSENSVLSDTEKNLINNNFDSIVNYIFNKKKTVEEINGSLITDAVTEDTTENIKESTGDTYIGTKEESNITGTLEHAPVEDVQSSDAVIDNNTITGIVEVEQGSTEEKTNDEKDTSSTVVSTDTK